ncbi:MAG: 50S ribosomal protein L4 [Bacteroidales bacterium]|jgi:large subunit ribosomal protein L4|nr:50S ribosomal protein L4 [Bacteroidales bacterium]
MELKVYKTDGSESNKKVALNDNIFNIEPNDHAIWLDVKHILANKRQGTHDTLEKSTISGSTRKLKRQKGTGGARGGSIKSPLLRGGATIFGPHPRDYSFKLNKKIKRLARFSALTYKAKDNHILVIEDLSLETPKTKTVLEMLTKFNLENTKTLILLNDSNNNVYLSTRNLPRTKAIRACDLNTYDVLHAKQLIIFENSIAEINKIME